MGRLEAAPAVERETLRRLLSRPRRAAPTALLAVLALVGAGWLGFNLPVVQLYLADQKTSAGETRALQLPDASALTLSTDSAVNIDMDGEPGTNRRTVKLLRGEVLAQVAKRGGAAFSVRTTDGAAIALGTAFTVRKTPDATIIAVAESRVRVCPALAGDDRCVTLAPGQRGRLTARQVERLPDQPTAEIGGWAQGWLSFDDAPLVEALDELNRWSTRPVRFDRAALADLRVSGVFPVRDPDRALVNLSKLLPIAVDRSAPSAPVVRRR